MGQSRHFGSVLVTSDHPNSGHDAAPR